METTKDKIIRLENRVLMLEIFIKRIADAGALNRFTKADAYNLIDSSEYLNLSAKEAK